MFFCCVSILRVCFIRIARFGGVTYCLGYCLFSSNTAVWFWSGYRSRCRSLSVSLLDGYFVHWLLFPLWSSGWSEMYLGRGSPNKMDTGFLMGPGWPQVKQ